YQADGNWMQMLWASRDNALLHYGIPALFFLAFWIVKSATPGKMATKMIIVDAETLQKPDPIRLIVRYIGYYVSLLPLGLGFLWILWDPKKQGWHDKMAKTVVIRQRPGADSKNE
ncbi:MAG TPA: RDD family protein, partial [Cellvibrionaceae bacterium]